MANLINTAFVATFLFLMFLCCDPDATTDDKLEPTSPSEITKESTVNASESNSETVKPIGITARKLTTEYKQNELAADKKYKDNPLAVNGKIKEIGKVLGSVYIELEGFKEHGINLLVVRADFPSSEEDAIAKLKTGQKATFVCTGDGMTANLYVGLRKCKVK